ncbi:hypothetical protein G7046_g5665 [Stylonectria norvegica]|nr:hypothetical protein G7046_g5665 [Stylonectria norvegica]
MGSIAERSRDVRRHLLELTTQFSDGKFEYQPAVSSSVTDALERFTLWAGNLGALRLSTKLSLDYRLQDAAAEELRDEICQQLDDILEATDDYSILQGTAPNRDTSLDDEFDDLYLDCEENDSAIFDGDRSDEASMIVEVISESISSLFRIGILVRKMAPRDRFKRALQLSNLQFPDTYDIEHVRQKYPKTNERLSERLGGAIAKRRQFIKYSRDHRSRLGVDEFAGDSNTRTERQSSKATTFVPESRLLPNIEAEDLDDIMSMMTASTTMESLSVLKLPQLADLTNNEEPFECPICFTLQAFQTEKSWRIHAFRDLKAYICTVGGTACASEFFGDRDSWFEHELRYHRARYSCPLCKSGPQSKDDMHEHIQSRHGFSPSDQQTEMLEDAGRHISANFKAQDCPFCNDWAETLYARRDPKAEKTAFEKEFSEKTTQDPIVSASRFKRHVATHQEQLAIFALPQSTEKLDTPVMGSVASGQSSHSKMAVSCHVNPDIKTPREALTSTVALVYGRPPEPDDVKSGLPVEQGLESHVEKIWEPQQQQQQRLVSPKMPKYEEVRTWSCSNCGWVWVVATTPACQNCGYICDDSCVIKIDYVPIEEQVLKNPRRGMTFPATAVGDTSTAHDLSKSNMNGPQTKDKPPLAELDCGDENTENSTNDPASTRGGGTEFSAENKRKSDGFHHREAATGSHVLDEGAESGATTPTYQIKRPKPDD